MANPGPVRRVVEQLARKIPPPPLDIRRFDLRIDGLSPELDGFCIAHISDLHIGVERWGPMHVDECSRVIRQTGPDVVVNTGDFLEGAPPWSRVEEGLHCFSAPRTDVHRNLAILGNHDYYVGDEGVSTLKSHLAEYGIDLLENASICIPSGRSGVSFVGLTDEADGFDRGLEELLAAGRPRVALVHAPDLAERLPYGAADLILSGHTHGGQIALPRLEGFIVRFLCGSRYVQGIYQVNGSPVYVNRGLGCVGLPARFRAAPELTIIRLVR